MNRKMEILELKERVAALEVLVGGKYSSGVLLVTAQEYPGIRYVSLYDVACFAANELGMKYDIGVKGKIVCQEKE